EAGLAAAFLPTDRTIAIDGTGPPQARRSVWLIPGSAGGLNPTDRSPVYLPEACVEGGNDVFGMYIATVAIPWRTVCAGLPARSPGL
ncbi:MAG: hypothetical protein JSW37_10530, partial [Anaerolineales bacterium]